MMLLYMCLDMFGLAHYTHTPMLNMTWWYLSYAILLTAAMPFIYKAYEKFRYLLFRIFNQYIYTRRILLHRRACDSLPRLWVPVLPADLRFWLKYIGKHSTNIFLAHTFIYFYYYPDFIYSFRSTWYVLPVFTAVSLAVSIAVEAIKKFSGYNRLANRLMAHIDSIYW